MEDSKELSGVVYRIKRRGPRTEPCGMPQDSGFEVDLNPLAKTEKDREVR